MKPALVMTLLLTAGMPSLVAQDHISDMHSLVIGNVDQGVTVWYSRFHSGGTAFLTNMRSNGQKVSNAAIYHATPPIPPEIIATAVGSWKLKETDPGVFVPSGEKVDGRALPAHIGLIPATFVAAHQRGFLCANAFDVGTKKPFLLPVLWLSLEKGPDGIWALSNDHKADQVLGNLLLPEPKTFRAGPPKWAGNLANSANVVLGLSPNGLSFVRQRHASDITVILHGGSEIGKPIRIDAALTDTDVPDTAQRALVTDAAKTILGAWTGYQEKSVDNTVWITTRDGLTKGLPTGKAPLFAYHLQSSAVPPSLFYVLHAAPYYVVGLRFPDGEKKTEWIFITSDEGGKPTYLIAPDIVGQTRELLLLSSVLGATGDSW